VNVIIEFALTLLKHVKVEEKSVSTLSSSYGYSLSTEDIPVVSLFVEFDEITIKELLATLKCLSIVSYWTNNTKVINYKLGRNFSAIILGLLWSSVNTIAELCRSEQIDELGLKETSSLHIKIAQYCILMMFHAPSSSSEPIDNSLPTYPWLDSDLDYIGIFHPLLPFEEFPLMSASLKSSGKYVESIAGNRSEWHIELMDMHCMELLLVVIAMLEQVLALMRARSVTETSVFIPKAIIALECELMAVMSQYTVLFSDKAKDSYLFINGDSILTSLLSTSSSIIDSSPDHMKSLLITRRFLHCWDIFKLFSQINKSSLPPLLSNQSFMDFIMAAKTNLDAYLISEPIYMDRLKDEFSRYHLVARSPCKFLASQNSIDFWPWLSDTAKAPPMWQQSFLEYRLNSIYILNSRSGETDLWFRRSRTGMMWQAIFDKLFSFATLNHQQTDHSAVDVPSGSPIRKTSTASSFENTLTSICTSLVRVISDRVSVVNPDYLVLPWFELQLILFLTRCFRHEPDITSQVVKETGTIRYLIGQRFLCYRSIDYNVDHFDIKVTEDSDLNMVTNALHPISVSGISLVAALTLNDATYVFLQEFFSYPSNLVSKSGSPTEDIMCIIPSIFYIISSITDPIDHVIFQLTRFIHRILIGYSHQLRFEDLPEQVLSACIEIYVKLYLIDPYDNISRPFLWAARSSIVSLIVWFSTNSFGSNWIDVLSKYRANLLEVPASTFYPSFSASTQAQSSDVQLDLSTDRGLTKAPPQTQDLVISFLLDPSLRFGGISILINLITTICSLSAEKTSPTVESNLQASNRLEYLQFILRKILDLSLSENSLSSQAMLNVYETMLHICRSITWLLRSDDFMDTRSIMQNTLRDLDIIPNLISAVSVISTNHPIEHHAVVQSIMRQVLSFIASLMFGNKLVRLEIENILASSASWKDDGKSQATFMKSNVKHSTTFIPSNLSLSASSSNNAGKRNYSNSTGLRQMILQVESTIELETMMILFEMMLEVACMSSEEEFNQKYPMYESEGLFHNDDDKPKIVNVFIISLLIHQLKNCEDKVQSFVIRSFYNLVTGRASLVNISTCCQAALGLFDLILHVFPTMNEEVQVNAITLLSTLGQYSISVAQMKHLFYLLQSSTSNDNIKRSPAYAWMLVQALQKMFKQYEGPRHSFIFDGRASGIQLSPISKWPLRKGLTVSMWFRLEVPKPLYRRSSIISQNSILSADASKSSPMDRNRMQYQPYLICMRNQVTGVGIEILLRAISISQGTFKVIVNYHRDDKSILSYTRELKNMIVRDGQWHHLTVAIQLAGGYANKAETSILLDDLYLKDKFLVPELPTDVREPMIGACPAPLQPVNLNTTLRGQIGAIYFFNDALSEGHVRSIKALGPTYFYSFEPYTRQYRDVSLSLMQHHDVDPSSVLDGSLTSMIVLAYNPAVCSGDMVVDTTPSQNIIKWKIPATASEYSSLVAAGIQMNAKKLEGTNPSSQQDSRAAFDALGGVASILPIFTLFDLPIQLDAIAVDSQLLQKVLSLLITVLDNTLENRTMLRQLAGFDVIASFITDVSPKHFDDVMIIDLLIQLFTRLQWDETYQDGMMEKLFCNFRLWRGTSLSTQSKLITWLTDYHEKYPHRVPLILNIEKILQVLYLFYDYESDGKLLNSSRIMAYNHEVEIANSRRLEVYHRPEHDDMIDESLSLIRSHFFSLINRMLMRDLTMIFPEDIHRLISYMHLTNSYRCKLEVLDFLYKILSNEENPTAPPYALLALACRHGFHSLLVLCHHSHVEVRLRAFRFMLKVIAVAGVFKLLPAIPTSSNLNTESSSQMKDEMTYSSSFHALGIDGVKLIHTCYQIQDWLVRSQSNDQLDEQAQYILASYLRGLVGLPCDDMIYQLEGSSEISQLNLKEVASGKMCAPQIFPCIVRLLSSISFTSSTRLAVLEALHTHVKSLDNCDQLLRVSGYLVLEILNLWNLDNNQGVADVSLAMIEQVLHTELLIGKPLQRAEVSRYEESKHRELTVLQAFARIQANERVNGMCIFLQTIDTVQNYQSLNDEWKEQVVVKLYLSSITMIANHYHEAVEDNKSDKSLLSSFRLMLFNHLQILLNEYGNFIRQSSSLLISDIVANYRSMCDALLSSDVSATNSSDITRAFGYDWNAILALGKFRIMSMIIEKITASLSSSPQRHVDTLLDMLSTQMTEYFSSNQKRNVEVSLYSMSVLSSRLLSHLYTQETEATYDILFQVLRAHLDITRTIVLIADRSQADLTSLSPVIGSFLNDQTLRAIPSSAGTNPKLMLVQSTDEVASNLRVSSPKTRSQMISLIFDILGISCSDASSEETSSIEYMADLFLRCMIYVEKYLLDKRQKVLNDLSASLGLLTNPSIYTDDASAKSIWMNTCVTAYDSFIQSMVDQLDEHFRIQASLSRSIARIKSGVLNELQNERGPWGDIHSSATMYWSLDPSLTNQLTCPKIIRNPHGSRHLTASQRSKSGFGAGGSSANTISSEQNQVLRDVFKFRPNPLAKGVADIEDDDFEESLANTVSSSDLLVLPAASTALVLFTADIEIITSATNSSGARSPGTIVLTKYQLSYLRKNESEDYDFVNKTGNKEFQWACKNYPSTNWKLSEILAVAYRRYQHRDVGIEIIFTSRASIFINAMEVKQAKKLFKHLTFKNRCVNLIGNGFLPLLIKSQAAITASLNNPANGISTHASILDSYSTYDSTSSSNIAIARALSIAWANREISNFDYLMQLNSLAGRSINDLGQYPVFPWIIADYTSSKLDLKDPRTFRDLRYPIGAQLESQRKILRDKYDSITSLSQDDCPPYHYGSHYSTAGFVIWYLMRMEPFTSYHVWLQDGKFDRPDRLFHSLEGAYRGCTTNPMDVKELIPEFFYQPEFLNNTNNIDYGTTQAGQKIGPVVLPPWAKNSHDFIRIHREALECDYVSLNLHHWIDLIFGHKQRPPHLPSGDIAAVESYNCFMHFTYADAVDLEYLKINDEALYLNATRQIENFGQTPMQLFDRPHPQRQAFEVVNIIWPIASIIDGIQYAANPSSSSAPAIEKPTRIMMHEDYKISYQPILFIGELLSHEKLLTIDSSRILGYHTFKLLTPDLVPPYTIKVDPIALKVSECYQPPSSSRPFVFKPTVKERRIAVPFAAEISSASTHHVMARNFYPLIGTLNNKQSLIQSENERTMRRERARDQSSTVQRTAPSITISSSTSPYSTPTKPEKLTRSDTVSSIASTIVDFGVSSVQDMDSSMSTPMTRSKTSSKLAKQSSLRSISTTSSSPSRSMQNKHPMSYPARPVDTQLTTQLFAYLADAKIVFSCGHWDNTFRASFIDSCKLIQSISHHRDVVTCLAIASDFHMHWLVTGSRDCTVMIWEISIHDKDLVALTSSTCPSGAGNIISAQPLHVLYGHDDIVNCIAVNAEYDLVCSGSEDGTIIMSTLRTGTYLRSIILGAHPSDTQPSHSKRCVHILSLTKDAYLIAYSRDGDTLCTYTINGRLLRMIDAGERLHCIISSEDGKVILTGGERCLVVMRWASTLALANTGARSDLDAVIDGSSEKSSPFSSPIRSMRLVTCERLLLIGLESGEMAIVGQDSEYLRRRLHRKLMEIGILPRSEMSGLTL
jgi:hypothetical protein